MTEFSHDFILSVFSNEWNEDLSPSSQPVDKV